MIYRFTMAIDNADLTYNNIHVVSQARINTLFTWRGRQLSFMPVSGDTTLVELLQAHNPFAFIIELILLKSCKIIS